MMGKVNFSDKFIRDAVAQITERGYRALRGTPSPRSLILSQHSSLGQLPDTLTQIIQHHFGLFSIVL